MNKETADARIAEAARTVYAYCCARTGTKEEAEDLSQDILLELLKSHQNIRDEKAFYGFMWALAGNVYKNWCKKRAKRELYELDESFSEDAGLDEKLALGNDLALLRRELTLLREGYRRVTVAYYFDGLSVSEISKSLRLSESMVKYLLFKSRQILKGGMNMVREYGELSFNPKSLTLQYLGEGPNRFWTITDNKKIPQNILWACYNDSLTEEDIGLQIGVAAPYLEAELKILKDAGLLIQKGSKYSANIIIVTKELKSEIASKVEEYVNEIADRLFRFIVENEEKIRSIGFLGSGMSRNSFLWHVTRVVLEYVFGGFSPGEPPVTAFGERAFVWASEEPQSDFNICNLGPYDGASGSEIRCMDYVPIAGRDYNWLYRNLKAADLLMKLACGRVTNPNDYEKEYIAELIREGYAHNAQGEIKVAAPVYTQEQFGALYTAVKPCVDALRSIAGEIYKVTESTLINHVPPHLKGQAEAIAGMLTLDDGASAAARAMLGKDYLKSSLDAGEMPMTYIIGGVFVSDKAGTRP